MHMADALISPSVGGVMWAVTAGLLVYSSKKIKETSDDHKVPLMGVLGAFIFATQMINFTIPATGSSGHLGGGMILSILLGPYAAFLVMASVLVVQALFFGDGGLLALGCNIFNLGFWPCFIAYPLIYKSIVSDNPTKGRIMSGSIIAAIIGLQLGAFSVVLQTLFSGIAELPFKAFVLMMQPIHLAIGLVEGLVTAAVIIFVWNTRPEILNSASHSKEMGEIGIKKVLAGFIIAVFLVGGALSWFASVNPDGLEWSMFKTAGKEELEGKSRIHKSLSDIQKKTAFLPDYDFKQSNNEPEKPETAPEPIWPSVEPGTSVSGIVGGAMVLIISIVIGLLLRHRKVTKSE